jgi:ATP-dependent Zn protease
MLDGTSNANDEYMQKLTAQNKNDIYIRLQPVYNKVFDKFNNKPDDVTEDNLENLNKIADEYIQENKKELDNLVRILLESENASL